MKKILLGGIFIFTFWFISNPINAQNIKSIDDLPDTTITLNPDTSDSYILSYYLFGR